MNGFKSPKNHRAGSVSARSLFALALAGWLSGTAMSALVAQETEAPAAPPALPSEALVERQLVEPNPVTQPVPPRSVRAFARKSATPLATKRVKPQLIPTGPESDDSTDPQARTGRFGEKTELIPTEAHKVNALARKRPAPSASAWAEPEEAAASKSGPAIRQVQAETLVPSEGLGEIPSDTEEGVEGQLVEPDALPSDSLETLDAPALGEASAIEEEAFDQAPLQEAAPGEPAPLMEEEEPQAEPAPLHDRVGNPQRVPTQFNINRTAAAEAEPTPNYQGGTGVAEFGAQDTVHTVAAGESFWSISKKHYRLGRYSAALAEYNKSRIPRPDRIKPGMKVIVPPVQTLEQKFSHLISGASFSPTRGESATPVKSGFFVDPNGQPMYRIGEGDTLSDIAHNHLGRSSRWPQIVSLNKDTLPDPDEMKLGMVLRLPPDASEATKPE